jgi:MFS family permease
MELPKNFSPDQLAFPYNLIYWSCKVTKSDLAGVFLFPLPFMAAGVVLFLLQGDIKVVPGGMWLAMLWSLMVFPMLYYGQRRVLNIFGKLPDGTLGGPDAAHRTEEARVRIYAALNDKRYYWGSAFMALLTTFFSYWSVTSGYKSDWLWAWSFLFFLFFSVVGGYGMACVVAFGLNIGELMDRAPLTPDPYHPDLFMGLKPFGDLAVVNALIASSGSLLFPLIFSAIHSPSLPMFAAISSFLGYSMFVVLVCAILAAFLWPLFVIKSRIEQFKHHELLAHNKEYYELLASYKKDHAPDKQGILQLLLAERAKLKEIRLFPFETEMLFKVFISILLPFIILFLQIYFKK